MPGTRIVGKSKTVKGAAGKAAAAPKAVAAVAVSPAKVTLDEASLKRIQAGRVQAAAKRARTSAQKATNLGFESVSKVVSAEDTDYINDWLKRFPQMVSYCASLMRNGHIEKSFYGIAVAADAHATAKFGKRVIPEGSRTFKSLSPSACVAFVVMLLEASCPDVSTWWKAGTEGRLDMELARKVLFFMLGVTISTLLPMKHKYCFHMGPLTWLIKKTWAERGKRLAGVTKDTVDMDSDYFVLSESMDAVYMKAVAREQEVMLRGINFSEADDWVVVDGDCYASATLVSETLGDERRLARVWEKQRPAPTWGLSFDYPDEIDSVPELSIPISTTAVSSPGQQSIDARVETALAAGSSTPVPSKALASSFISP